MYPPQAFFEIATPKPLEIGLSFIKKRSKTFWINNDVKIALFFGFCLLVELHREGFSRSLQRTLVWKFQKEYEETLGEWFQQFLAFLISFNLQSSLKDVNYMVTAIEPT